MHTSYILLTNYILNPVTSVKHSSSKTVLLYVVVFCSALLHTEIISVPPGKERLADCLGITPVQASQFIESFMQKYKKVHEFTKKTIEQCRNKGNPKSVTIFCLLICTV